MTMAAIRILVVDDHTLFRRGLTALLAARSRSSPWWAKPVTRVKRSVALPNCSPNVILLDNHLPGVNGVDALQGLREAAPQAKVLMLTVSEDGQTLATALQRGASGYLLKTVDSDVLAVRHPPLGGGAIHHQPGDDRQAGQRLSRRCKRCRPAAVARAGAGRPTPCTALSPRERQILAEIARGASNKEIARTLAIAEATVKIHVQHILRKLNLSSRVQAAVFAAGRSPV
jgi:two-component system nitrate/nitrite response regulator NarL